MADKSEVVKENPEDVDAEIVDAPDEETENNDVELLRKDLEAGQKEAAELHDRLLRMQAETENYRKRLHREHAEAIRYANEGMISELLPVIDDFERAIESADKNKEYESLAVGIKIIFNQLKNVLQKAGLTEIQCAGQPFDPNHHQAVQVIESDDHEEDTVVQEMRKGYMLHGKVLRPSMVGVSKKKV